MRLIDADELKKKFKSAHIGNVPRRIFNSRDLGYINQVIDNAPTILPKQGEWIEKVETKQLGHGWLTTHEIVCSFCGGSGENDENIPQCWNFCPNCGAKMGGGAE